MQKKERLTEEVHELVLGVDVGGVLGVHGVEDLEHVALGAVARDQGVLHVGVLLDEVVLVVVPAPPHSRLNPPTRLEFQKSTHGFFDDGCFESS